MSEKVVLNFDDLQKKKLAIQTESTDTIDFIIVGAGGTGGYLLRDLVRVVALKNEQTGSKHTITIIDGDTVETKNLTRQNFVEQDVGKNKAIVNASRYGRAFGLEIHVIDEFLTSHTALADYVLDNLQSKAVPNRTRLPVFIDCVDNNATRLYIANASSLLLKKNVRNLILSSGNAERTGQVILTCRSSIHQGGLTVEKLPKIIEDFGTPDGTPAGMNTPGFFDIFPNISIDKDPTQLSCAEQAESAPQNIVANITASNILFSYAIRLLNNEKITTLAVFFNTKTGKQSEFEYTKEDLNRLLVMTSKNPRRDVFFPPAETTDLMYRREILEKMFTFTSRLAEEHLKSIEEEKERINAEALSHLSANLATQNTSP